MKTSETETTESGAVVAESTSSIATHTEPRGTHRTGARMGENTDAELTNGAAHDGNPSAATTQRNSPTSSSARQPVAMFSIVCGGALIGIGLAGIIAGTTNVDDVVSIAAGLVAFGAVIVGGVIANSRR